MTNAAPDQSSSTNQPAANQPAADHPAPEKVYENLKQLDKVGIAQSASYRQDAIAVLADTSISLDWRQAIADRLGQVDRLLSLKAVDSEDSY